MKGGYAFSSKYFLLEAFLEKQPKLNQRKKREALLYPILPALRTAILGWGSDLCAASRSNPEPDCVLSVPSDRVC